MQVWDPSVESSAKQLTLAQRFVGLTGKRLGLLDNGKKNSDLLLERLGDRLQEDDGVINAISLGKRSISATMSDSQCEKLQKYCDFVVTGVGD